MTKRDPGGRKRSLKLANEMRRRQKDDDFGPSGGGGGGGGVGKREAKDTLNDDAGFGGGAKSSFEGLIAPHAMKKATKKAKFLESESRLGDCLFVFRDAESGCFLTLERARSLALFLSLSRPISLTNCSSLSLSLSRDTPVARIEFRLSIIVHLETIE